MSACAPQGTPDATDQAPVDEPAPRKQIIQPEGVARLPVFSSAVRSGDLIFLSGAIGALPGVSPPTLAQGGVIPETRQAMDNLRVVLEAAGAGWEDVVKCTVFLADMADYAAFNEVYLEYFPPGTRRPAPPWPRPGWPSPRGWRWSASRPPRRATGERWRTGGQSALNSRRPLPASQANASAVTPGRPAYSRMMRR